MGGQSITSTMKELHQWKEEDLSSCQEHLLNSPGSCTVWAGGSLLFTADVPTITCNLPDKSAFPTLHLSVTVGSYVVWALIQFPLGLQNYYCSSYIKKKMNKLLLNRESNYIHNAFKYTVLFQEMLTMYIKQEHFKAFLYLVL